MMNSSIKRIEKDLLILPISDLLDTPIPIHLGDEDDSSFGLNSKSCYLLILLLFSSNNCDHSAIDWPKD